MSLMHVQSTSLSMATNAPGMLKGSASRRREIIGTILFSMRTLKSPSVPSFQQGPIARIWVGLTAGVRPSHHLGDFPGHVGLHLSYSPSQVFGGHKN